MSSPDTDPDLALVEALAGGDEAALNGLMDRYQQPIFHFIYRHVPCESDAQELTQEVFVRLYFNVRKFKPQAKFSTWLYQIALNLCRDHFKSKKTRQAARTDSLTVDDDETPSVELAVELRTPSDHAVDREKLAALDDGMAALPDDLRSALVMSALEQRSHQECADILKTTPKAIETRIYRARKFLLNWMLKAGFSAVLSAVFWRFAG